MYTICSVQFKEMINEYECFMITNAAAAANQHISQWQQNENLSL